MSRDAMVTTGNEGTFQQMEDDLVSPHRKNVIESNRNNVDSRRFRCRWLSSCRVCSPRPDRLPKILFRRLMKISVQQKRPASWQIGEWFLRQDNTPAHKGLCWMIPR